MFARLQKEVPQFVEDLAKKGISYVYQYQQEANPGSNLGNSIARAYPAANLLSTDDEETKRRKIEEQVKRHSDEWRWGEDGSLSVTHRLSCMFPALLISLQIRLIVPSSPICSFHSNSSTPLLKDSCLLWQFELDVSQSERTRCSRISVQRERWSVSPCSDCEPVSRS